MPRFGMKKIAVSKWKFNNYFWFESHITKMNWMKWWKWNDHTFFVSNGTSVWYVYESIDLMVVEPYISG